jgi:repressor LexA
MTTTTNIDLTARQEEVLAFIRDNAALYGPTVREIATAFNIKSPNGVICHLTALERKGRITRAKGSPRGIQIVEVPDAG